MRINRFIATGTGLSRRGADIAIADGRVLVDGAPPKNGQDIAGHEQVTLDGKPVRLGTSQTILFNKPAGYITSRTGQGGKTIYELLPPEFHKLKPVGRLDKYSSGVLLLTSDGQLAQQLTHPKYHKTKLYEITLDHALQPLHRQMIADIGVQLADGPSRFTLERLQDGDDTRWRATMHEGRNRQIRRTFEALGYQVRRLHRTQFGEYAVAGLKAGDYRLVH
ncbi:MAG TPA: pseudouridine synthase [Candidatus Saccharimonadales bacterium]|nr:pseudouridine synthase [Candidatus Saccharimonadales bacterium]